MTLKNIAGALKILLNEWSSRSVGDHAGSAVTAKGDATLAAVNDINLNTMDKSSHQTSGKNQADSNNATRTV